MERIVGKVNAFLGRKKTDRGIVCSVVIGVVENDVDPAEELFDVRLYLTNKEYQTAWQAHYENKLVELEGDIDCNLYADEFFIENYKTGSFKLVD